MNLSFLRPLALPRPATLRAFYSTPVSTTTQQSITSSQPLSPSSKLIPIPLITAKPSATTYTPLTQLPVLTPYHVARIPKSKKLPVYQMNKRGGNLFQTKIRKISGDVLALRKDLQEALKIEKSEDCVVNSLTGHVVIKGHWRTQVERFLVARKF